MALTKSDLTDSVKEKVNFPKKRSAELIESILEIMKQRLESGEDVLISGFGKFCVKDKGRRRGRNPQTGEELMLDRRRVITYKCSTVIREKINGRG